MTADERTEAEARADRSVRRGDLSTALSLYRAIAESFPGDQVIAEKLQRIEDTLQPAELTHSKARSVGDGPASRGASQQEEAEALAGRGDYPGAIAIYRALLAQRPDNELIRERLAELFQLAQAKAPRAAKPQPGLSRAAMLNAMLERIAERRRS